MDGHRTTRCGSCGTAPPRTARFCGRCGAILRDSRRRGRWWSARLERTVASVGLLAAAVSIVLVGMWPAGTPGAGVTEVELPDGPDRDNASVEGGWPVCHTPGGEVVDDCVRWRLALPAGPAAIALVGADVVVADETGRVRSRSLATGELRWATEVAVDGAPTLLPVVADTLPVSTGGRTVFLDRRSGATVGALTTPDPHDAVAIPGWLVTSDGASLTAWSVTGTVAWTHQLDTDAAPLLVDGAVLVGHGDGRLVRLTGTTGEPRWEVDLGGAPSDAVRAGEHLVVATAGPSSQVVALTPSGAERWRIDLAGEPVALAADAAGTTVTAVEDVHGSPRLVFAEAATGQVRGPVPLRPDPGPPPRDVVATGPHTVAVVDDENGVTLWSRTPLRRWRATLGAGGTIVHGEPLVVVGDGGLAVLAVPEVAD